MHDLNRKRRADGIIIYLSPWLLASSAFDDSEMYGNCTDITDLWQAYRTVSRQNGSLVFVPTRPQLAGPSRAASANGTHPARATAGSMHYHPSARAGRGR